MVMFYNLNQIVKNIVSILIQVISFQKLNQSEARKNHMKLYFKQIYLIGRAS